MTNAFCRWREEEIADFLLDKLAEDQRRELQHHLDDCPKCASLLREWSELLGTAGTQALSSPSSSVRSRLMRRIACERWITSMQGRLKTGPAVAAAALLFLCVASLFSLQGDGLQKGSVPTPGLPETAAIPEAAMVMDPDTVLHIAPVVHSNVKSYVWVNNASNEMLILTEGLAPSEENDYQVWFVTKDGRSRVGLLHWRDGMAHLYFRGGQLGQAENIAVSIEPKGGSFLPTGPDTIFVNLR